MSSVKRTQITPTDLGQPKAPDKCDQPIAKSTNNHHTATVSTLDTKTVLPEYNNTTVDASMSSSSSTNSSSMSKSQSQQQQQQQSSSSRDAQKSSNSTIRPDAKKLENFNDEDLKSLLDEAYSYKGPKDKENKSETFKKLLHNAELEDQKAQDTSFYQFATRSNRVTNRRHPHTHGGSLQDLVESVNSEQFSDGDYLSSGQSRRQHQQNSRYHKHTSSVSSRQREGGSLPSNVNVSTSQYPLTSLRYVDSFNLNKQHSRMSGNKSKSESHDNEQTTNSGPLTNISRHHYHYHLSAFESAGRDKTQIGSNAPDSAINSNDINHTIINIDEPDETRHLLAHDSLAQGLLEPNAGEEGTELVSLKKQRVTNMNYIPTNNVNMDTAISEPSRQNSHSVEKTIPFFSKCGPQIGDSSQLSSKSIAKNPNDTKYLTSTAVKYPALNIVQASQKQLDENGNAILSKASGFSLPSANQSKGKGKRNNKSERNTKTWTVPQPEGSDSAKLDNIDSLVAFIENNEKSKKPNIINVNKNIINSTDRSRKEKKNTSKKDEAKLKKSTSMEELKSSSKIEEEIAQSERAQVSMRQKQMQQQQQQTTQKRNNGNGAEAAKESNGKQQQQPSNKRSERRSWGTEELNYLGERDVGADERDMKKQKDSNAGSSNKPNTKTVKKTEQQMATNESVESIPANVEAAEFHVVTKKKKTKKRQILEEAKAKQQSRDQNNFMQNAGRNANNAGGANGNRYQPSNSYTNDRDVYLNSLTTKENRRKSASSMPPSDKSDSSDLDSIHSLPIESTTACTPIISYADIARTANQPEKLNVNAWPTVSYTLSSSSTEKPLATPDNSNLSTCSSTVSSKSQVSTRVHESSVKNSPVDTPIAKPPINATRVSDDKATTTGNDETLKRTTSTSSSGTPTAEAKYAETIKLVQSTPSENTKNQLQKSKSVDSEKYTATMSLDQFPGLEKTVKPQKSHSNFATIVSTPTPLTHTIDKTVKIIKKSSPPPATEVNNVIANAKESIPPKAQKSVIPNEKPNNPKPEVNQSKLVFVQNNAKAEEIANSDSSNLFVPINVTSQKKSNKKIQSNSSIAATAPASASVTINKGAAQQRPAAVIFSDHETNNENVSPLLFGDFNDDILQLMKQDDGFVQYKDDLAANKTVVVSTPSSYNKTATSNYNTFESAEYNTVTDSDNGSNLTDITTMTQSDPGYSSTHHSTQSTESPEMVDIHRKHMQSHANTGTTVVVMPTEVAKQKTNFNSNLNNNKTSDVVSNQSINNNVNNNCNKNNILGDVMLKNVTTVHTNNSDLDNNNSSNNTTQIDTNDKDTCNTNRFITIDGGDVNQQQHLSQTQPINHHHHQNHNSINSKTNANNNPSVYKVNAKSNTININNNNSSANNYLHPNQGIINYDNVNSKNVDNSNEFNANNRQNSNSSYGTKTISLTKREVNKYAPNPSSSSSPSSIENDNMITTNSHINNTSATNSSKTATLSMPSTATAPPSNHNDSLSSIPVSHSHEKIVNFVGLAWEDILHATNCGGAHYYNGQ